MKKNIIILLVVVLLTTIATGCANKKDKEKSKEFKDEYESLNGKKNSAEKEHRTISIAEDNPYEKVSQKKIVEMIDSKETFYLYVGDSLCPWCRSVLEKSIEVAKEKNIKKIYYVDIWDDEGNEIFRDKYEIKDGNLEKVKDGTKEYHRLLKEFDRVLSDYTLTDEDGNKVEIGEKRIFAPNFFYVKNGKVKTMITGISTKQKDSREKLTKDILNDEKHQFNKLFSEK
jgi:thiol-disulfide isomerase/thioredoxin